MICALSAHCTQASAQEQDPTDIIERILENAAEGGDDADIENSIINSEYLIQQYQNPIDINSSDTYQLMQIPAINGIQARRISEYKDQYGSIASIAEIKTILNESDDNIKLISRLIKADSAHQERPKTIRELMQNGQHSISSSTKTILERQKGYTADQDGHRYYDGNATAWTLRYRYNAGNRIAWGITMEKDAGESIGFRDRKYGFDFNSGYLKIENMGRLKKIVAGDLKASFGQGLILGGGMGMGRQTQGIRISQQTHSIREYTSTNETSFIRGAGASVMAGKTMISAFAGANLTDATCNGRHTFQSIKTDGMHRTATELSRKDNLRETHAGIMATHIMRKLMIGAAAHYSAYDKTLTPPDEIRHANMWTMRKGLEVSASYHYSYKTISIYGETAMDARRHLATINYMDIAPSNNIRLTIMQRAYSKEYRAMKASSYSQNTGVGNEEGIYCGASIMITQSIYMSAWADIYRMPWLSYRISEPTSGHECSWQTDIKMTRQTTLQIKGKTKDRQQSDTGRTANSYLKITLTHSPSQGARISTTAQWSRHSSPSGTDHGYMICQNAQYKTGRAISAAARIAIFSAPYNARIYSYENDVSMMMAAPAYFYSGIRYYLILGTQIIPKTSIQMRISQWRYWDRSQISSGQQMIDANHKSELSIYVKYTI